MPFFPSKLPLTIAWPLLLLLSHSHSHGTMPLAYQNLKLPYNSILVIFKAIFPPLEVSKHKLLKIPHWLIINNIVKAMLIIVSPLELVFEVILRGCQSH